MQRPQVLEYCQDLNRTAMTLAELLPEVQRLSGAEKHQLLQILVADLENSEPPLEDSKAKIIADLKQSLDDVQAGKLFPLETLWDGIDA